MKIVIFFIFWFLLSFIYLLVYGSSENEHDENIITQLIITILCLPSIVIVGIIMLIEILKE